MHTHPSPSAHVCTTLPPGNLPMRDKFSNEFPYGPMYLESACGSVSRHAMPVHTKHFCAPIGCWSVSESRIDSAGQEWIKHDSCYLVVDDFGNLMEVRPS